jgi:hypothetical protein
MKVKERMGDAQSSKGDIKIYGLLVANVVPDASSFSNRLLLSSSSVASSIPASHPSTILDTTSDLDGLTLRTNFHS